MPKELKTSVMETAPTRKDRYLRLDSLGEGGQGCTYRAVDQVTQKKVAMKVIQLRGAASWKPFDLFERECQVLRSLDHPGIPHYLDAFSIEEEGTFFLIMELVEGVSLHQILVEKRLLDEAQLWNILHQTLIILSYLHQRRPPVIHRDIKPANLILGPDARLSLVDFGGVRVALRPDGGSTVVGTFGYMAPEQLHGEATAATDIYGLGATLATLATGLEADKLPRTGLRVDLAQLMPLSPLRDLLLQMLEPDPTVRLCSVTAVQQAARGSAKQPAAPASAPSSPLDDPSSSAELDHSLSVLVRVFGSIGYVGLVILDSVILPLVFTLLGAAWSNRPRKLLKLQQREQDIRGALDNGRQAMKELAMGRDPYTRGKRKPPHLPPAPPKRRELPPRDRRHRGRRHR